MSGNPGTTSATEPPEDAARAATTALIRALILLALAVCAFWPELCRFTRVAASHADWAHALVVPAAMFLLLLHRRAELAAALGRGSAWGLLFILAGFGLLIFFTWPGSYAYPRDVAVVVVSAGAILASCGWGVLKRCLPLLLLLLLCVPISARVYAALSIKPETYTISATHFVLDRLPGVDVDRAGPDLDCRRGGHSGSVALGEPHRGAGLLAAYVAIGVFVVFARIRPLWQVVLLAVAALPIAFLCNFLRLLCWGLLTIYARPDPISPLPRAIATAVSLLLAYLLFAFGCWLLSHLVVESDDEEGEEPEDAIETEHGAARPLPEPRSAAGSGFRSPVFISGLVILVAGALGMHPTAKTLAERYTKEPIGLRRLLTEFDVSALKSFRKDYSRVSPNLSGEDLGTEDVLVMHVLEVSPSSRSLWSRLFVTYYADPRYMIPHTPEVCARQAGYVVTNLTTAGIDVSELRPDRPTTDACVFHLERGAERLAVAYVLCANGEFCHDRDTARWIMARPGGKRVYVSKIEADTGYNLDSERELALEACKQLLSESLTVLVRNHFPTADDLNKP